MESKQNDKQYYAMDNEQGSNFTLLLCRDEFNMRLRVDDYNYEGNMDALCSRLTELMSNPLFTKLFVKTRETDMRILLAKGYMLEGIYKGYFDGEDAYCMAKYTDLARRASDHWIEEDHILEQVLALQPKPDRESLAEPFSIRKAEAKDAGELAFLYGQIFQTYPIPMNDPGYVAHVMEEGTLFVVVEHEGHIISAASAEINTKYRNAELTDCLTLPAYRGHGLMRQLLHVLEEELQLRDIRSTYSLSRALSFGMNAALFQLGYDYQGRLTKNCDIYDKFEDMNLWCKMLPEQ
ncbi:putative beta-lysine N-acetyltransferase [Paenibacillus sp. CF384]|uniref:putative beta-lysine N-acetyltransferase n=1 Tax=Paenibacillus sp. CF384 TaxID=1884382 RepID=UPI000898468D|nr:putative beta-lysine N-acetyltransferase [Paenibacillus sp. CF384]SDW18857.1 beta-lysine acetyltransferase [Paenibacillus sp. CF384]